MDRQSKYLRALVGDAIYEINQETPVVFYHWYPKNGVITLDCRGDLLFKINDMAWMTYAINIPPNCHPERIQRIKNAELANYQCGQEGNWLWNYIDIHYDILNVLKEGVKPHETERFSRAVRDDSKRCERKTGRRSVIRNDMGSPGHREVPNHQTTS